VDNRRSAADNPLGGRAARSESVGVAGISKSGTVASKVIVAESSGAITGLANQLGLAPNVGITKPVSGPYLQLGIKLTVETMPLCTVSVPIKIAV
jgi:hypothetical protein